MPTTTALITSRDTKGQQAVRLFEAAYDKAKLNEDRAQRLNESADFTAGLRKLIEECSLTNQFADEEVESTYVYPAGYAVKPIDQQIDILAKIFGFSLGNTIEFMEKVFPTLTLPDWAEGWFAIPSVDALAARFFKSVNDPEARNCEAVKIVLAKIAASRSFSNYREGQITPNRYRRTAQMVKAMDLITAQQNGDVLVVPGQFGMRHRGRSVRRAREVMTHPEFGFGSVAVGSMLLTHPERLVSYDDIWIDATGDEFSPEAVGQFSRAPYFYFYDGEVKFGTDDVGHAHGHYGSASGAVPQ